MTAVLKNFYSRTKSYTQHFLWNCGRFFFANWVF